MNTNLVDLRTDTCTLPTEAMYAAMASARLGDDGWRDDPTVLELEQVCAALLGKEAAVFVPSGTMANLLAMMAHTGRAGEVLAEARSHIFQNEMGGIGTVAGLSFRPIAGHRGAMNIDSLAAAIQPAISDRTLKTAMICVENTHTAANGAVLPPAHMKEVHRMASASGIPLHLDGARIFNAAVALDVDVQDISRHSDTVAISLYKGLSAPAGAVLAGPSPFVQRALMFRKMLGGVMRQSGLLAACGLVALREMPPLLGHDHAMARRIANGLHDIDSTLVEPDDIETNILTVDIGHTGATAQQWANALRSHGILVGPLMPGQLRVITHRHVDEADADRCIAGFRAVWQTLPAS